MEVAHQHLLNLGGSSGAGGGADVGSVSVPPSKAIGCGGEVALGGCSLSESASWFEEVVEVTA